MARSMGKLIVTFVAMMAAFEPSFRAFGAEQNWCYGNDQCPKDFVCEGGGGWSGTPGKCYPREQHSCWKTSECSAGYYCLGAGSYQRGRCTIWPPVDSIESDANTQAERCWLDEDCEHPKRCDRKSDYIPGYCI